MSEHTSTGLTPDRYLEAIESNSARFAEALTDIPGDARVPTCPAWNTDELIHHLAVVQHFWGGVVREGLTEKDQVDALRERDPLPDAESHEALLELLRDATARLVDALRDRSPNEPVWSWSPEQTAGFVLRRQAHEACIHRIDAELTAAPDGSARTLVDPMLAADGVDEVLRLIATFCPAASGAPENGRDEDTRRLRVVASDTGTTWLVTVGPNASGIDVAEHDPADGTVRPSAIVTGTAEDLVCTFWGRPPIGAIHRTGDLVLVAELERVLASRPGG